MKLRGVLLLHATILFFAANTGVVARAKKPLVLKHQQPQRIHVQGVPFLQEDHLLTAALGQYCHPCCRKGLAVLVFFASK
jgi:hypothetical protein